MREGLAFEDVTIIPKKSSILSRKLIDTSADLVKGVRLRTPIISANMDTVTEWKMAVEMARLGESVSVADGFAVGIALVAGAADAVPARHYVAVARPGLHQ